MSNTPPNSNNPSKKHPHSYPTNPYAPNPNVTHLLSNTIKPEDITKVQSAVQLANSGQRQKAYEQLVAIYNHGNHSDIPLLFWIASTTPYRNEIQITIDSIARLDPNHPHLQEIKDYVKDNWTKLEHPPLEAYYTTLRGPILQCPYCHTNGPTYLKSKILTVGWVWFALWLILSLCWFSYLPTYYQSQAALDVQQDMLSMILTRLFTLLFPVALAFIGLAFRKNYYACSYCKIAFGDISR